MAALYLQFIWVETHRMDSGQGEDVAGVFTSLVTATTSGEAVCYITMSAHLSLRT